MTWHIKVDMWVKGWVLRASQVLQTKTIDFWTYEIPRLKSYSAMIRIIWISFLVNGCWSGNSDINLFPYRLWPTVQCCRLWLAKHVTCPTQVSGIWLGLNQQTSLVFRLGFRSHQVTDVLFSSIEREEYLFAELLRLRMPNLVEALSITYSWSLYCETTDHIFTKMWQ